MYNLSCTARMGPQRDASDDPPESEDSIEALLRATDRDTAEVVDALQDGGQRRHVSETSVDDVLTELPGPEAETSDDPFALSGGPKRTVSTSGIDEVFETLEDEAPALPAESQVDASSGSAGDESAANGSGSVSASTAADAASGGAAASSDRADAAPITFDRAGEEPPETAGDEEPFGALVGGEPTRTVSDASVDDILDSLDEDQAESAPGTPSQEAGDAADALRPADPEGELVDLLTAAEAPSPSEEDAADDAAGTDDVEDSADDAPESTDPEDRADEAAEADDDDRTDRLGEVDGAEGQTRVADAAAALSEHRSGGNAGAESEPSASGDDEAFEWTDPAADGPGSESTAAADEPVATEADTAATGDSRPLVSRSELEEIAANVTNPESPSTEEPASGSAAGPGSTIAPDAASSREAVSVDAVNAETDASLGGATRPSDAGDEPDAVDRSAPSSGIGGGQPVDRSGIDAGSDASLVRRIGSILRRFTGRLRR